MTAEFPHALYRRLLRCARKIDKAPLPAQKALYSILCGKPSSLYSYDLKQNIPIGTNCYSMWDLIVSIQNDGEYSSPTASYPRSLSSLIRNSSRLFSQTSMFKNSKNKDAYTDNLLQYIRNITFTDKELTELTVNLECLANIATKYEQNLRVISNTLQQSKNNMPEQVDVIEWNDFECISDADLQQRLMTSVVPVPKKRKEKTESKQNKKKKKHLPPVQPVLNYLPKGLNLLEDFSTTWKTSLLFEHPLHALSRSLEQSNYHESTSLPVEPYILLGLPKPTGNRYFTRDDASYVAIALNGERSMLDLGDLLRDETKNENQIRRIRSTYGSQMVPEVFWDSPVYIGGDDVSTFEVLTVSPYCKGVPVMNKKMYWCPDLSLAARIMSAGYATVDQFRFYQGKMSWDSHLWKNIEERNLYGLLSMAENSGPSSLLLAKQLWEYPQNEILESNRNLSNISCWYNMLQMCSDSEDVASWMQLFELITRMDASIQDELYPLIELHNAKIRKQVKHQYNSVS